MEKDSYCKELSRYIHLNPVRGGLADRPSEYRWSSYSCYIGKEKKPAWLTTESVLGYFGDDDSSAQDNYGRFVDGASKAETKNPLKDVFASTFLGSPEFITWAKEKLIDPKNADTRNVPVLRELVDRPSLEQIRRTTESVIGGEHPLLKKICIYVSHQYSGFALKEIGAYYGMRGSAISQSSRRFKQRILADKKLKKTMTEIERKLLTLLKVEPRPYVHYARPDGLKSQVFKFVYAYNNFTYSCCTGCRNGLRAARGSQSFLGPGNCLFNYS